MNNHLISIIIPTYNRAHLIGETLDSIIAQTYQNWECIIVDDGSTDNTEELINKYKATDSRFQFFHRPDNRPKGGNACRNYGFEKSKGDYVNWFDSDDLMDKDFIAIKRQAITSSDLDAVISKRMTFVDGDKSILEKEKRTILTLNLLEDFLTRKVTWYLPDVMWRRSFLENKTLFNEILFIGQDRDFHARMLIQEPSIKVIDCYLTLCRLHLSNITSQFNKERSLKSAVSHIDSVSDLLENLRRSGKITKNIKHHYFKQMMRYLPIVYKDQAAFTKLNLLLKSLSYPSASILICWIKYRVAEFTYKIFGKGYVILK